MHWHWHWHLIGTMTSTFASLFPSVLEKRRDDDPWVFSCKIGVQIFLQQRIEKLLCDWDSRPFGCQSIDVEGYWSPHSLRKGLIRSILRKKDPEENYFLSFNPSAGPQSLSPSCPHARGDPLYCECLVMIRRRILGISCTGCHSHWRQVKERNDSSLHLKLILAAAKPLSQSTSRQATPCKKVILPSTRHDVDDVWNWSSLNLSIVSDKRLPSQKEEQHHLQLDVGEVFHVAKWEIFEQSRMRKMRMNPIACLSDSWISCCWKTTLRRDRKVDITPGKCWNQ